MTRDAFLRAVRVRQPLTLAEQLRALYIYRDLGAPRMRDDDQHPPHEPGSGVILWTLSACVLVGVLVLIWIVVW